MQQRGLEAVLREKYQVLAPLMNERSRRRWAAAEAQALGRGGQTLLARVTGMSRSTVYLGQQELAHPGEFLLPAAGRIRQLGGGRKLLIEQHPELPVALEALVEPTSRGDPQSPLRWTCKSVRRLAAELKTQGHQVSPQLVSELLHTADYSLQGVRKTREGGHHPDRNAQFEHLN